jgi:hypothetical protein
MRIERDGYKSMRPTRHPALDHQALGTWPHLRQRTDTGLAHFGLPKTKVPQSKKAVRDPRI